jgi:hypothetical protein
MSLTTQQAEGLLLTGAIRKFIEDRIPTTHFKGFFTKNTYNTTAIPIEVMRDNDLVAVDVMRGTNGNLNEASQWSAKTIVPPFYHEKFNINDLRFYERAMGMAASAASSENRAALASEIAAMLNKMNKKIIRAEEIQCAQVLETGVVTLINGDSIDYKRLAGSLVDLSVLGPWTTPSTDIEGQLQDAITFISQTGGNTVGTYDITMSNQAWITLKKSTWFKDNANYNKVTFLSIGSPQNRNGATFHGQVTAGSGIFNIWTYDGTYLNSSGVRTRIFDTTKIIIVPTEGYDFELAYGAIDQIVKLNSATSLSGVQIEKAAADYYVWDNIDKNNLVHTMHMTSAPVARLISVDQVYTIKVAVSWTTPSEG